MGEYIAKTDRALTSLGKSFGKYLEIFGKYLVLNSFKLDQID